MRAAGGFGKGTLLMAAVAAVAFAAERPSGMPYDRLLRVKYGALDDPHQGRLYEAAAGLLQAARGLPAQVDLGIVPSRSAVQPPVPEADEPKATPPAVPPVATARQPRLLQGTPVVGKEELAYTLFQAGSYADAATLYRDLRAQQPDDAHLLVMLLLCERNAGNAAEAAVLLEECRKAGPEAAEWANWLAALTKLNAEVAKEDE